MNSHSSIDRRVAFKLLGGSLGAVFLANCASSGLTNSDTSGKVATDTTTSGTAHTVTPEGEIGPYFTDDSAAAYNRSNLLANIDGTNVQPGVPLTLKVRAFDTRSSNAPMAGVQVDIWHCNALGVYSNESVENTTGQTWLRGYQLTDAQGAATFVTIIPGWYEGRTTHIHVRIRSKYSEASSTNDGTNTTQVFFSQATLDTLYTSVSPYNSKGKDSTTNVGDHVYTGETHSETELALSGSVAAGFTATFDCYLPITAE